MFRAGKQPRFKVISLIIVFREQNVVVMVSAFQSHDVTRKDYHRLRILF